MINVTKTFLPPQKEYNAILKRAWDKNWMTNRGVLVQELEDPGLYQIYRELSSNAGGNQIYISHSAVSNFISLSIVSL